MDSPTKKVLVFKVPSLIGIVVDPADVVKEKLPLPSFVAVCTSVVRYVNVVPSTSPVNPENFGSVKEEVEVSLLATDNVIVAEDPDFDRG